MLCFVDGETIVPMESARDYKRVFDQDKGPNTGGMGCYSPNDVYTPEIEQQYKEKVMFPTLEALKEEGIDYRGVLYFGLMVTGNGIKVLEFNCRFGDPETQVILPRLESDLVEIMTAVAEGKLKEKQIKWKDEAAVCVILASGGYPGSYQKGRAIKGLEGIPDGEEVYIFHAGTRLDEGTYYTNGGRVLGITAIGKEKTEARKKVYKAVENIGFEGVQYRSDIAK